MPITRYDNRKIARNDNELYEDFFIKRNINFIKQYRTGTLKHPTTEQSMTLEMIGHVWKTGDRFYKLAQQHYGDPRLWWVIAWFNQTPTEHHLKLGDGLQIPLPLERVLGMLGV